MKPKIFVSGKKGKIIDYKGLNNEVIVLKCKYNHAFEIEKNNLMLLKKWCPKCKQLKDDNIEENKIKQEEYLKEINKKYVFLDTISYDKCRRADHKIVHNHRNAQLINIFNGSFFRDITSNNSSCYEYDLPSDKHQGCSAADIQNKIITKKQKQIITLILYVQERELIKLFEAANDKKNVFRKCVLLLHPDKNPYKASKEAFIKLVSCYKISN